VPVRGTGVPVATNLGILMRDLTGWAERIEVLVDSHSRLLKDCFADAELRSQLDRPVGGRGAGEQRATPEVEGSLTGSKLERTG